MLGTVIDTFSTLVEMVGGGRKSPATRISRYGMPNGFFLHDMLVFGGLSARTPVARGFVIEPGEINAWSNSELNRIHGQLARLLRILGQEYTLQVQWSIDSDYRRELEGYHAKTLEIRRRDPIHGKFGIFARAERYERYLRAMEEGRLRRERLTFFFCKIVDSRAPSGVTNLAKWYEEWSRRESDVIGEFGSSALHRLFADCRIRAMRDEDHFLYYYRFLNPNTSSSSTDPLKSFDPALSIQQNCVLGEGYTDWKKPGQPGATSFCFDCYGHAVLVLREWPRTTSPGIASHLTHFGFRDYAITLNIYPKSVEKEIRKEEDLISRLLIDAASERKVSLAVDATQKTERVGELQRGNIAPFLGLFVVRLWSKDPEELSKRVELVKQAFATMGGAIGFHARIPETARRIFYQTWPGWTCGGYRHYDLNAEDSFLADMIPFSASFTGHLDDADAIFNGARSNLVGIKLRQGSTPQHGVVLGMSSAGKSVLVSELIAQTGHVFGFRVVVEEGLSHGVLTQAQGCEPLVIDLNGNLTFNYLDTGELPLSREHLNMAAGLCMLFCGERDYEGEEKILRHSMIVEKLQELYTDVYQDWVSGHEKFAEELRWRAYAIYRYLSQRIKNGTFLDAFVAMRDWEMQNREEAQAFIMEAGEEEIAQFTQAVATRHMARDLAFAYLRPEEFPTHSALTEMFLLTNKRSQSEAEAYRRIGRLLRVWSREGDKGVLFDGVSNVRLDGRVAHFDLVRIPEQASDIRAAANFLVASVARQKIISMPRAVPKLAVFEEAARTLDVPGGDMMIKEYYRQMRKFGCNILAVVQQYEVLKNSKVRGAVMGNSKVFFITAQQSVEDAEDIGQALELNPRAVETIRRYTLPEYMPPLERYSAFTYVANDRVRRVVGSVKNVPCREVLYAAKSDNDTFDQRKERLAQYSDIVEGIIAEASSLPVPPEEFSCEPI
jgi:hypothetical protein